MEYLEPSETTWATSSPYTNNELEHMLNTHKFNKEITKPNCNENLLVPKNKYTVKKIYLTNNGIKKTFLLSVDILTDEERNKLVNFCQCAGCTCTYWIQIPYITIPCPCCVGCISQDLYVNQYVLNKTRKYYDDNYGKININKTNDIASRNIIIFVILLIIFVYLTYLKQLVAYGAQDDFTKNAFVQTLYL